MSVIFTHGLSFLECSGIFYSWGFVCFLSRAPRHFSWPKAECVCFSTDHLYSPSLVHIPMCIFLAVIYRSWCETRLFSADTDINIWELKTTTSYWRIGFLFLGNTHLSLTALDTGPTGSETQSSHWTVSHVGRCPVNSWRACGADGLHLGGDVGGTVSMLHLCSCECSYWCQHVCWRECVCVCVLRRCYCRILAFLLWNNECFPMCVCVCVCVGW